jgi:hypothetical protein
VSAVAVLPLAFGIGANCAVFSIVDGLLLRSLPVRFVGTLLFGVAGRDGSTLLGSVAVLIVVAPIAAWIPERRAALLAPVEVLRGWECSLFRDRRLACGDVQAPYLRLGKPELAIADFQL